MTDAAPMARETAARMRRGVVIPAHPLALTTEGKLDERSQRALTRYYADAGVGGVAVGVHTTQFAIREHGLLQPVLELAADAVAERDIIKVAGVCGATAQAIAEASLARDLGYDLGLLNLAALKDADDDALVAHTRAVGEVIPIFGFYLQPAIGGRVLEYPFWRKFADLPCVRAIKVAPFDRYQTLDVLRAVSESGRDDIALYTGNDDTIVHDLLTAPFVGGLLGHWAVWTRGAVALLDEIHTVVASGDAILPHLMIRAQEVTDCNAAFFDARNGYAGCIAGIHEILHRQGLLATTRCLDPSAGLSPGQAEEIDRVCAAYPHLADNGFVAEHRDRWLA